MEEFCVEFFVDKICNEKRCRKAHQLTELLNIELWVLFETPELDNINFIAYKYQGHYKFKWAIVPGRGVATRLTSKDDVEFVVNEYQSYRAQPLSNYILPSNSPSPSLESFSDQGLSRSSSDPGDSLDEGTSTDQEQDNESSKKSESTFPNLNCKRYRRNFQPHSNWEDSYTAKVLKLLHENKEGCIENTNGWLALEKLWGIKETDLDEAVLRSLKSKDTQQQEHMLLSFAAIDLSHVKNLSAYLNCLIREHESTNQVCLYFLAEVCCTEACQYVHPEGSEGWNALSENWNVSYKDFDYTVLNYLSKKSLNEQDSILLALAEMNLGNICNLSAYLSSMIQKHDNKPVAHHRGRTAKWSWKQQSDAKRSKKKISSGWTQSSRTE